MLLVFFINTQYKNILLLGFSLKENFVHIVLLYTRTFYKYGHFYFITLRTHKCHSKVSNMEHLFYTKTQKYYKMYLIEGRTIKLSHGSIYVTQNITFESDISVCSLFIEIHLRDMRGISILLEQSYLLNLFSLNQSTLREIVKVISWEMNFV